MPSVRVRITATGQVLTLDVEEYLRGVVPNESPASWPMEELKAQAVAARTYALAQSGIMADDERSQVYRPGSTTPRTDDAIRATAGVVGTYQGVIRPMFFSASCGGSTLSNWGAWLKPTACPCASAGYGVNGHRQGLCQQGARILADRGYSYLDILNHYYNMVFVGAAPTVTSKLAVHYQTVASWAKYITTPWQKVVNPGGTDTWPGSKTIGRFWVDNDNQINPYLRRGAIGADEYFQRCLPMYRSAPWVYVWEGPNEPQPMNDNLYVVASAAFWSRYVDLMHSVGLLVAIGSWGVTWPRVDQITLFKDALTKTDYWTTHEYAAPRMQDGNGGWTLLYRKLIAALRAANIRVPPLLITECGIDCGVIGDGGKGWKVCGISREQYAQQLAWYDAELCKDPEVLCATVFTAGPASEWVTFEVDEELARWIAARHTSGSTGGAALETFLGAEAQKTVVPLNPNSAFEKYATPKGWLPASKGFDVRYNGILYSVQVYRWAGDRSLQYIVFCETGKWDQVHHFTRPN